MSDSQQLLAEYVREGSEAAFRELVSRYLDFVYSAALRLVDGDGHRAQDVAQTVFVDLARKAGTFAQGVMLGGWLHRHTCFVAANVMRGERRRQARERLAVEMSALEQVPEADFSKIAPILDEAINELDESERTAIVLRFFERRDFRAVGEAIGGSEDGARMRVNRALGKLEVVLKRHGVSSTAAALSVTLAAHTVQAAPAGLAAAIVSTAGIGGSAAAAMGAKIVTMSLMQKFSVVAVVLASVATPVLVHFESQKRLEAQGREMKRQAELLAQLETENERLTKWLIQANGASALPVAQMRELLRLRNHVGGLKRDLRELAQLKTASSAVSNSEPEAQKVWSARVEQLKQWAEGHPAEKIPEMRLVDDQTWVDAIYPMTLESDQESREAMSTLRANAELRALDVLGTALRAYGKANGGQYPQSVSELASYAKPDLDEEMLSRYEIVPAQSLARELQTGEQWLITLKAPVDEALDSRLSIGMNGGGMADVRVTNRWVRSQ